MDEEERKRSIATPATRRHGSVQRDIMGCGSWGFASVDVWGGGVANQVGLERWRCKGLK